MSPFFRTAPAVVLAAFVCGWLSDARAVEIATVAMTGDLAPGAGGAVFDDFIGNPVVNGAGEVAFLANLSDGNQGIWAGKPGSLALLAKEGDAAPGVGGAVFSLFEEPPLLNGAGAVAFKAVLRGNGAIPLSNSNGIWAGGPGTLALVAREGDRAPGAGGAVFSNLRDPVLNGTGAVAFRGDLGGGGEGIWVGGPTGLALVAKTGDRAPGTGGARFRRLRCPVLNDAGTVAFGGKLSGGGERIWVGGPAGLDIVAKTRRKNFNGFDCPVLNGAGAVAFVGYGAGVAGVVSIWAGKPDSLALVANTGDRAPGTGLFFGGHLAGYVLNGAGEVAFQASIRLFHRGDGIWAGKPGGLVLVAREGKRAPGTGGAVFTIILEPLTLNGAGQLAFMAGLRGGGVGDDSKMSLWAGPPGGLQLIVREGDAIEVAPGDFRTVGSSSGIGLGLMTGSGNEDGRASGFSEGGQVAFRADFTDDSQGIFLSPPEAPSVYVMPDRAIEGARRRVPLPRSFENPLIIAGPPSYRNKAPGVVRLGKIQGAKARFKAHFKEWQFPSRKGKHPEERTDFLVLEQGRHLLADGSIWEAGTVRVRRTRGGSGPFRPFTAPFPGAPRVFLTVQPSPTAFAAATRAYDVTPAGFRVRADDPQRGPRIQVLVTYTVGYLAVFSPSGQGTIAGGVGGTDYRLKEVEVNHRFKKVLGERIKLQEGRSKDKETKHKKETVSVMTLGRGLFAQQASNRERDTTVLRRR